MKRILIFGLALLVFACTQTGEPEMHPDGWLDPASEHSHMAKIATAGIEGCRTCHGNPADPRDYYGGSSGVSCSQCHESGPSGHPPAGVWVGSPPDSTASAAEQARFHGTAFLLDQRCDACHDYYHATAATSGGTNTVGVFCTDCHTRDDPPGNKIRIECRTCHNGTIAFPM